MMMKWLQKCARKKHTTRLIAIIEEPHLSKVHENELIRLVYIIYIRVWCLMFVHSHSHSLTLFKLFMVDSTIIRRRRIKIKVLSGSRQKNTQHCDQQMIKDSSKIINVYCLTTIGKK